MKANQADVNDPLPSVAYYESYRLAGEKAPGPAVEGLMQAVSTLPSDSGLRLRLVNELESAGRYAEAIDPLKRALDLKPDNIQCIKSLGLAAFALGRKESSLQSYRIALSLNPRDEEALFGLGILFVSSGDLKAAYRQYELLAEVKSPLGEDLYAKIVERKELRMG